MSLSWTIPFVITLGAMAANCDLPGIFSTPENRAVVACAKITGVVGSLTSFQPRMSDGQVELVDALIAASRPTCDAPNAPTADIAIAEGALAGLNQMYFTIQQEQQE